MRSELVDSIRAAIEEAQHQADAAGREVVVIAVAPAAEEPEGFNRPWKDEFLEELRRGRTVRHAAELAGVSPRHVYRSRKEDPRFSRAWKAAKKSPCDVTDVTRSPG